MIHKWWDVAESFHSFGRSFRRVGKLPSFFPLPRTCSRCFNSYGQVFLLQEFLQRPRSPLKKINTSEIFSYLFLLSKSLLCSLFIIFIKISLRKVFPTWGQSATEKKGKSGFHSQTLSFPLSLSLSHQVHHAVMVRDAIKLSIARQRPSSSWGESEMPQSWQHHTIGTNERIEKEELESEREREREKWEAEDKRARI